MTSIQFFRAPEPGPYNPPEWGTGGPAKEKIEVAVPRNPTWRYTGKPVTQYYGLTQLKLSNIRSNDELVPRPQAIQIGKEFIDRSFPAEHPYSSHVPRFAVFPTFASSEDPKRGVVARSQQPISSEMPANPYDTTVLEKTKGFPYRHEFQDFPKESEKTALYWPGEDFFDQHSKVHGHRQQFYPIPPKTMCPNLQTRPADQTLSARTANAVRNVEREQWQTSHQRHFTGLGPANPPVLDNLGEKTEKLVMTGREDDKLYPHTQNTYDPPRGLEGRLPRKITPLPLHQKNIVSATSDNPDYKRKMTLTEREEHRLLNGTEYLNLPDTSSDPARDVTWRELDTTARAGPGLEKVEQAKAGVEEVDHPYPQAGTPPPPPPSYLAVAKSLRDMDVQELEAQNRWKVLEQHGPAHDRTAINKKMEMLHDKERPATFYGHEGRYNEERAGLYKTSYDPHRLAGSMNSGIHSAPELLNTLHSHRPPGQGSLPAARLTEDVSSALKWSRTFSLSQPELSGDRRDGQEVVHTYHKVKSAQRGTLLPPGPHQARPLTQERELLQREATTMGDSYNATKFLQDANLDRHARGEPLHLMSSENQSLNRVRSRAVPRAGKNVQFNRSVTVATMSPTSTPPLNVQTAPLQGEEVPPVNTTQYTSTHALYRPDNEAGDDDAGFQRRATNALRHSAPAMFDTASRAVRFAATTNDGDNNNYNDDGNNSAERDIIGEFAKERYRSFPCRPGSSHGHGLHDSEYTGEFRSLASNFMPSGVTSGPGFASSYQAQFPVFDLGYKHDARFDWQPGSGLPRPQTSLLQLQDAFVKSDVRRRFHDSFPETNPELRFNIIKGKKHSFGGFNAQEIHG